MNIEVAEYSHGSHYSVLFDESNIAQSPERDACPACGTQTKSDTILEIGNPSWSVNTRLVQCVSCELLFYSNPPSEEYLKNYYESTSNSKIESFEHHELSSYRRVKKRMAKRVMDLGYKNRDAKILDIGCGTGDLLAGFQEAGFENLWGCEMSPFRVAVRQQRFPDRIFSGGFEKVPDDMRFDIIYANHVIEHIYTPSQAFDWMRSHLTDDGMIILSVPDAWHEPGLNQVFFLPHLHSFSALSLAKLGAEEFEPLFALNERIWDVTVVYPRAGCPISPSKSDFAPLEDLKKKVRGSQKDRIRRPWASKDYPDEGMYSMKMTYKSKRKSIREDGFHRLNLAERTLARTGQLVSKMLLAVGLKEPARFVADLYPYVTCKTGKLNGETPIVSHFSGNALFDMK